MNLEKPGGQPARLNAEQGREYARARKSVYAPVRSSALPRRTFKDRTFSNGTTPREPEPMLISTRVNCSSPEPRSRAARGCLFVYICDHVRLKGNGATCRLHTTRSRVCHSLASPWAQWLRWAVGVAVFAVVSVSVLGGWVAGGWPKMLTESKYRREDI